MTIFKFGLNSFDELQRIDSVENSRKRVIEKFKVDETCRFFVTTRKSVTKFETTRISIIVGIRDTAHSNYYFVVLIVIYRCDIT